MSDIFAIDDTTGPVLPAADNGSLPGDCNSAPSTDTTLPNPDSDSTATTIPESPSVSFTTSAMTAISTYGAFAVCQMIIFAASVVAMTCSDDRLYTLSFVLTAASHSLLRNMAVYDYGTPPLSRSHLRRLLLLNVLALVALMAVAGMTNKPLNLIVAFFAFPYRIDSLHSVFVKWYRDE